MEKLKEIWKDIVGYEDLYQVSNLGNIKSYTKMVQRRTTKMYLKSGKLLKQTFHSEGYLVVGLTKDNKTTNYFVHKLVADAFLPKIEDINDINHIDGDKRNNNVFNLERCTRQQNIIHAYKILKRKSNTILSPELLENICLHKANGLTNRVIAKLLNISHTTVNSVINKSKVKHYGN